MQGHFFILFSVLIYFSCNSMERVCSKQPHKQEVGLSGGGIAAHMSPAPAIANKSTLELFEAIRGHSESRVAELLGRQETAFNFHGVVSNQDLSATDWTALMVALGELKSILIAAQSAISSTGIFGGWFGGYAAQRIKNRYDGQIRNLVGIIKRLCKVGAANESYINHNGICAATLCEDALKLLNSPELYPPYKTRIPEADYIISLEDIRQRLTMPTPCVLARSYHDAPYFSLQSNFEVIDYRKPPIVYHEGYTTRCYGLENMHPFDSKKYRKIADILKRDLGIEQFYSPQPISAEDLLRVHSPEYLLDIRQSATISEITDVGLIAYCCNRFAENTFLRPALLAAGGTMLATNLAFKYGWAINLGGGFHHAKRSEPVAGGFCFINDCLAAAAKVLAEHPDYRILIVDLDAHQGNGNADIAKKDGRIGIFDMYNRDTWPGDVQERINFEYPLPAHTADDDYLLILEEQLSRAIDIVRPNLIMYNAGTDPLMGDPLGKLRLTKKGIFKRDVFVFKQARERKIPLVMMLSGGYHPTESVETISGSIVLLYLSKLL